ncbi:hypothetical protein NEDG_01049 [Nematocida displodere]|uniref:Uncharacterized protein n=1 Tax=Nematocida displodere TaxID=1805483 RepID=A0A177EBZ1_9MICR|nr:hypothetical protein NEDG_01049 [Nematocida displodere]
MVVMEPFWHSEDDDATNATWARPGYNQTSMHRPLVDISLDQGGLNKEDLLDLEARIHNPSHVIVPRHPITYPQKTYADPGPVYQDSVITQPPSQSPGSKLISQLFKQISLWTGLVTVHTMIIGLLELQACLPVQFLVVPLTFLVVSVLYFSGYLLVFEIASIYLDAIDKESFVGGRFRNTYQIISFTVIALILAPISLALQVIAPWFYFKCIIAVYLGGCLVCVMRCLLEADEEEKASPSTEDFHTIKKIGFVSLTVGFFVMSLVIPYLINGAVSLWPKVMTPQQLGHVSQ